MTAVQLDRSAPGSAEPVTTDASREPKHTHSAPGPVRRRAVLIYAGLFVAALALRLFEIRRSYDIFIDEITYSAIGRSIADGHGVLLYGAPFNLHPPTVFALLGLVERWFGLTGAPPDQLVLDLRPVVALFGAGIVVIATTVARRCGAGLVASAVVASALALDPFEISFDSRVMLEAPAQLCVASCVAFLLLTVGLLDRGRRSGAWWSTLGAGVCAGAAFTSKETFGLVLVVLLLLMVLVGGMLPRRHTGVVLGVGALCYLTVAGYLWSTTGFSPWWAAHTSGIGRLIGTDQTTGFNASSTKVSLASRVAANVDQFGVTYAVLVLGGLATLAHLVRSRIWRGEFACARDRAFAIVALWALAACGYLVYATGVGSIEEQMYYIPLAPVVVVLGVGLSRVSWSRAAQRVLGAAVVAGLVLQSVVWVRAHSEHRDLYEQFFAWERVNVVAGARIGLTELSAQFVLDNVSIGTWTTLPQLLRHHADYVLVQSDLVAQGYSSMSVGTLNTLRAKAQVAFSASAPGEGTLYLFDLRALGGGA